MDKESEESDLEPWNEETYLEPWVWIEKFHLTPKQRKEILKHIPQESDGFLLEIERFIERHKSSKEHPALDLKSAYMQLDTISKAARNLKLNLLNLNPVSKTFIRQHCGLLNLERPDLKKLVDDLEHLSLVTDSGEPEPGKRGPRGKPSELLLCQQVASAWKRSFNKWPGKNVAGPFHRALDVILPLANYETIGEDIVEKAIDAAVKEETSPTTFQDLIPTK